MNPKAAEILRELESAGFRGRIIPAKRIADIGTDILSLKGKGLLDPEFYDVHMSKYRYDLEDIFPAARSLIVVAVPSNPVSLTFCHKGKEHRFLVPPTYVNAMDIDKKVRSILEKVLAEGGVLKAPSPLKTIAARTGLARYGKNNIAYSEGFGSYHRLTGFFTETDLETDHWQEIEVMEHCTDCELCLHACPTGAISGDRFLLRAERCLTFHNEMPNERAFPSSIKPTSHNSLVGCMRCQDACPINRENVSIGRGSRRLFRIGNGIPAEWGVSERGCRGDHGKARPVRSLLDLYSPGT